MVNRPSPASEPGVHQLLGARFAGEEKLKNGARIDGVSLSGQNH
jgi:hypothetical protein